MGGVGFITRKTNARRKLTMLIYNNKPQDGSGGRSKGKSVAVNNLPAHLPTLRKHPKALWAFQEAGHGDLGAWMTWPWWS